MGITLSTRESGSQDRLITPTIRELGSTLRLITPTTTLLMLRELPSMRRIARSGLICGKSSLEPSSIMSSSLMTPQLPKAGEDLWAVTKEAEKKMKDEQDEEERKKADEEAKKDE